MKIAYMYATPDVTHSNVTAIKGEIAPTLALIRSTGYSGVELLVRDPESIDSNTLESAVRAEGLDLPAICTGEVYGQDGLSFADPDLAKREHALARMKAALELASRFGAMVNVGRLRGRYVDGIEPKRTLGWISEALVTCATAYPNVAIVMEPVNRQYANCLVNTAEMLEFIRSVDLPNIGLMLDNVHMTVEHEVISTSMQAAANDFWHFHISDSDRLPLGIGDYCIADVFDALAQVGYSRYVTVETFQIPDAHHSIEASFKSIAPFFKPISPDR